MSSVRREASPLHRWLVYGQPVTLLSVHVAVGATPAEQTSTWYLSTPYSVEMIDVPLYPDIWDCSWDDSSTRRIRCCRALPHGFLLCLRRSYYHLELIIRTVAHALLRCFTTCIWLGHNYRHVLKTYAKRTSPTSLSSVWVGRLGAC